MVRTASCNCGQLTVTTRSEPTRVSLCHCLACQKRTGSAFGVQARFRTADATIAGRANSYVRTGDAGHRITFHFCPECGATVHYAIDGEPDSIAIPVGAFADPTFPAPAFAVYDARRHPWLTIAGVEILD